MLKLVGLTVNFGALHFQGILTILAGPVKVNMALAGQLVGTVIVTDVDWPGDNTPFCGKNVMPLTPLLEVDQLRLPWAFALLLTFAMQVQVEFAPSEQSVLAVKLLGLTDMFGAWQLHVTLTVLLGVVKVKVALFGQVVLGTEMATCAVCPEDTVPLDGEKLMPLISLLDADQFKLGSPGLLELKDSVSVHDQPVVLS
jgi:hypothetical protein